MAGKSPGAVFSFQFTGAQAGRKLGFKKAGPLASGGPPSWAVIWERAGAWKFFPGPQGGPPLRGNACGTIAFFVGKKGVGVDGGTGSKGLGQKTSTRGFCRAFGGPKARSPRSANQTVSLLPRLDLGLLGGRFGKVGALDRGGPWGTGSAGLPRALLPASGLCQSQRNHRRNPPRAGGGGGRSKPVGVQPQKQGGALPPERGIQQGQGAFRARPEAHQGHAFGGGCFFKGKNI